MIERSGIAILKQAEGEVKYLHSDDSPWDAPEGVRALLNDLSDGDNAMIIRLASDNKVLEIFVDGAPLGYWAMKTLCGVYDIEIPEVVYYGIYSTWALREFAPATHFTVQLPSEGFETLASIEEDMRFDR